MYLSDDEILIGLYGLIGICVALLIGYAAREWRFERRQKRADAHAIRAKAQTWNVVRGGWVADDDS
jgi:hypothetical protein